MCAAALKWAQLARMVFAASDPKEGFSRIEQRLLHKKTEQNSGILAKEASTLLKEFFQNQRKTQN
jgi:tRNA(adenine34) deaminase